MAMEYLLEKRFFHSSSKLAALPLESDVIAWLKNRLHFIEVKTTGTQKFGLS
jgi:Holliday junction resolvase-like predicted endonuclease